MADPELSRCPITDVSWQKEEDSELINDAFDGRSMLGFSLTSPDLVICAGSPEITSNSHGAFPKHLEEYNGSTELSLDNGFAAKQSLKTPSVKFSTAFQTFDKELSPDSSFELLPPRLAYGDGLPEAAPPLRGGVSVNSGCTDAVSVLGCVEFSEDSFFAGGDTVRTNAVIDGAQGQSLALYQTARFGDFTYCFRALVPGSYAVDLHFAEIVFTNGPPGMRVFDVFVQDKKVVNCLDIYAQVGANKALVIPNIRTSVNGEEGLFIRFEGVKGSPIVCGISVTKDSCDNTKEEDQLMKTIGISQLEESESPKVNGDFELEGDYQKLLRAYACQKRELEELRRENQLKNKECQDAWKSLKDLQNELMRKSMHVGSLAFAIEGQVKEKGKWFSSLRDMTRKLKIMKMEHIKLAENAQEYKKYIADINEIMSSIQPRIKQYEDLNEDLKIKFMQGAKERKELYNKVLELKGNIRVFCRCRPLNTDEIAAGASTAIDFESAKDGDLTVTSNGFSRKTFKFDAVFSPQANQADVFEDTASFATSVLDGYNVCIFAYGQTGTGKTFTMEGTEEDRGVNFRTLEQLFHIIKERQNIFRYNVSVSVLEVYNEQIRDLLALGSLPGAAPKRLEVRQISEGLHHVPGLVEAHVNNVSEVWEVLRTGSNARAIGSTNANEHSSRSHCINCVMVKGENLLNGERTNSKLWLVDLAGSERVAKTEVVGDRLKETQNINKSLSALGDVISALATKSPHIPFRNSKLTHLLQDSLGGDSKALMFVQISPTENDLGETLCSLNFASRVRGIELGPAKRQWDSTTELMRFKQMHEKSKQDLKSKDVQIKKMEDTISGLDLKLKEKESKNKNLQEKVKELESQLLIERKLARQHVDTKIVEQQQQQLRKQQMDEQNNLPPRPPLAANRLVGANNNFNEPASGALSKDKVVNLTQPLTENNSYKPLSSFNVKYIDPTEKENKPEMAEQTRFPKRTGRASICAAPQQILSTSAPRRNSLIPLPSGPSSVHMPPLLPLALTQINTKASSEEVSDPITLPKQTHCESPKGTKIATKKLSTLLRRSLQRKAQTKLPMQQQFRKGGINVGMEKVRVSIGSRGRMAHRLIIVNGKKVGTVLQQKQNRKELERGWNTATAV